MAARKKDSRKQKNGASNSQIERKLDYLQGLEKRMDESLEHKLFELKAVSYVSLFLSAVLVALVLGILLRAIGV